MSASVQTNLQSCQKAGSTQELPTHYLPETAAHERDIPGLGLTSLGLTCFQGVSLRFFCLIFTKTFLLKHSHNKSHYLHLSSMRQLSVKPETVKYNIINYAMKIYLIETCFNLIFYLRIPKSILVSGNVIYFILLGNL